MLVQNMSSTQAISHAIASTKSTAKDYKALVSGLVPSAQIDSLDPTLDGVKQVTDALQEHTIDTRVQIISQEADSLQLGTTQLDSSNLGNHRNQFQAGKTGLADRADSLLYNRSATALTAFPTKGINGGDPLSQLVGVNVTAPYNLIGKDNHWNLAGQTITVKSSAVRRSSAIASSQIALNTITVTSAADSGRGSLREAIATAAANSTIQFASSLTGKTIVLKTGELAITKNLSIDGSGAANLTISGNKVSRVFNISDRLTVTLNNLTIANGKTLGAGGGVNVRDYSKITVNNCKFNSNAGGIGGGLRIGYGGSGSVTNSSFTGNNGTAAKSGFSSGAIATNGGGSLTVRDSQFTDNQGINGGAIYSLLGPLTVENSQFRNNSAGGDIGGGAIFTDGGNPMGPGTTVGGNIIIRGSWFEGNRTQGEGGALFLYGYGPDKILLENSTVVSNTATPDKKGIARGGGLRGNSEMTIRNVTFANNTATKQGGGIWIDSKRPVNIVNSTFSGNKALNDAGGAMFLNTGVVPVNVINSTIANNSAGRACGALWMGGSSNPITLTNSIVANNTATDVTQQQVGYQPRNGGGNIEFPSYTRGDGVVKGSRIVDPRLSPLQNINGVLVYPLLSGSPAINTGVRRANVPTTDQRGYRRDRQIDVGAFEVGATSSTVMTARAVDPTTIEKPANSASPRIFTSLDTQQFSIAANHPLQITHFTQSSVSLPQSIWF